MFCAVTYLVFLIIVTTSIIAQGDSTSTTSISMERIIGGTDVPFGRYPWFAKARRGTDWGGMFVGMLSFCDDDLMFLFSVSDMDLLRHRS